MNFERKYQTNPIQEIKSTKSHTLKRLMSDKIANKSQSIGSSKLPHTSKSLTGLFGRIGKTAPENTRSCNAAIHSF